MSRNSLKLKRRLTQLVKKEIEKGMTEDDIISALEIVKCNVAIAAASINASQTVKPNRNHKNN